MDSIQSDRNLFGNEILGHALIVTCIFYALFGAEWSLYGAV